jgi:hypothetical protein
VLLTVNRARLAQSVEHQTFKAGTTQQSEGQGFKSLIGRLFFFYSLVIVTITVLNGPFLDGAMAFSLFQTEPSHKFARNLFEARMSSRLNQVVNP